MLMYLFQEGRKEVFYLTMHLMVKDHSDSDIGNPLLRFFYMQLYQLWSTGSTMKDRSDNPSRHERTLLTWGYISLPNHGTKRADIFTFLVSAVKFKIKIHANA